MSITKNRAFQAWEDLLIELRGKLRSANPSALSDRDVLTYSDSLVIWGLCISESWHVVSPRRSVLSIRRWLLTIACYSIDDVASILKELLVCLRNTGEFDNNTSVRDFKRLTSNRMLAGVILTPVCDILEDFLVLKDATHFAALNQFLSFIQHITLRDYGGIIEERLALEYIDLEDQLSSGRLPPFADQLQSIMTEWFAEFSFSEFIPSHGNGIVAERGVKSKFQKYRALGCDQLIQYWSMHDSIDTAELAAWGAKRTGRASRVIFVPKGMNTRRTISAEPSTLQYLQHGVMRCIDKYIKHHPYLSHVIHLHDQTFNGNLALRGSFDRTFSTYDLSSASDTVSWALVKHVFKYTPLIRSLFATRSTHTLLPVGGAVRSIRLHKFAPMGSSLCFPIETLIFACLCEMSVRNHLGHRDYTQYSVYGDDIIVASRIPGISSNLEQCGFRINTSKSFTDPQLPFRESCGIEGWNGMDVSPIRLSRRFHSMDPADVSNDSIESYVTMLNDMFASGFYSARAFVLWKLFQSGDARRWVFSDPGCSIGIHSYSASNFKCERKYNRNLQLYDIKCIVERATWEESDVASIAADGRGIDLFHWLANAPDRDDNMEVVCSCHESLAKSYVRKRVGRVSQVLLT